MNASATWERTTALRRRTWHQTKLWHQKISFTFIVGVLQTVGKGGMDTGSGSRATLHHSGLLLPQAPLCAEYSFDQLWRHTQGLRKHAAHLCFTPQRLEGLMTLQQNVMAQRVLDDTDNAARVSWQSSLRDLESSEDQQAAALLGASPEVGEQLQRWWAVASEEAAIHEEPTEQGVSRRGFFRLHALLSRALLPECREQRALKSAEDDWLGLQAGGPSANGVAHQPKVAALLARTHLSRERFEAAVLELAQVWSSSHHAHPTPKPNPKPNPSPNPQPQPQPQAQP